MRGRFLIRRDRLNDLPKCLNQVSKAYQSAQRQRDAWEKKVWNSLWTEAKDLSHNGETKAHAKVKNGWWLITFSKTPLS